MRHSFDDSFDRLTDDGSLATKSPSRKSSPVAARAAAAAAAAAAAKRTASESEAARAKGKCIDRYNGDLLNFLSIIYLKVKDTNLKNNKMTKIYANCYRRLSNFSGVGASLCTPPLGLRTAFHGAICRSLEERRRISAPSAAALALCKRYNGRDSGRREGDGKRASDGKVTPPHATRNNCDGTAGLENGILINEGWKMQYFLQ